MSDMVDEFNKAILTCQSANRVSPACIGCARGFPVLKHSIKTRVLLQAKSAMNANC